MLDLGSSQISQRHDKDTTRDAPNATNMQAEISGVIPDEE